MVSVKERFLKERRAVSISADSRWSTFEGDLGLRKLPGFGMGTRLEKNVETPWYDWKGNALPSLVNANAGSSSDRRYRSEGPPPVGTRSVCMAAAGTVSPISRVAPRDPVVAVDAGRVCSPYRCDSDFATFHEARGAVMQDLRRWRRLQLCRLQLVFWENWSALR